jgi:TolA-binding protein
MASDKAWYWLAAGVLALGINGAYQDGEFAWAHRIADRSTAMVQQVRNEGCRLVAMAEMLLGRDSSGVERVQDQLARVQDQVSRRQMERMQRQMEMAQYQVERAQRMVVMQQDEPCSHSHRFMVQVPEVNVPAVNVRAFVPNVNVPAVTVPAVTIPAAQIPEIRVPQVTIPRIDVPTVRIPAVKIPPVHVQVDNDDDDGMI